MTPQNAPGYLRKITERMIGNKQIDPWCGICHSRQFRYEDGATKYTPEQWEEAEREIARLQAENARARKFFESSRN
jgi:hypothetical protein